jgi:NitT/TauT family transport system substrate-binding protein
VVVTEEGHTGIDALLVKPDQIKAVADVKGKRLGVLGGLPASVQAMLAAAGLHEGKDFTTVQLDGYDPVAHFRLDIAGRPGFKSNEPGILQRAGVPFTLLDPGAQGIPGSFGIVFSSQSFVKDHPTAAQDFVRATLKGLAAAVADPDAAVQACMKLIDTAGNQNHLTEEGERFRWQTESKLVVSSTPKGMPLGAVDAAGLEAEVTAYTNAGVFTARPSTSGTYDAGLAAGLYDAQGNLRWPA